MNDLPKLNIARLNLPPVPDEKCVDDTLQKAFKNFHKKVIVLDDDPTGTQTVHDVPVYTNWSQKTLEDIMEGPDNMAFILTNSRSFSQEQTTAVHKEIGRHLARAAKSSGKDFLLISRGDSTLRGHYPLETQVLKDELEKETHVRFDGEILCPYFKEGGRVTIHNIHYVQEGDTLVPAGQTEFARDKTFGYTSSNLGEYVEEKSGGKISASQCIFIPISMLRQLDYTGITQKLLSAGGFQKIIVNAQEDMDLKVFMICWLKAMAAGRHFLARSAASLTRIAGNISPKPLLSREQLVSGQNGNGGLVIVGSHVQKTTLQLQQLKAMEKSLCFLEFHADRCFQENGLDTEADRVLDLAQKAIAHGKTAVVYTSRQVITPDTGDKEQILGLSVRISQALTSIVSRLTIQPGFILAKGGITSSDVATKGLGIKKAMVMGQIKKGIPVWMTGNEAKFPHMPYIIFPGNVGDENTLKEIVEILSNGSDR